MILFGDLAATDVGVGLPVLGVSPPGSGAPSESRNGSRRRVLGHENRSENLPDTVDGLDGVVAGVVAEDVVDVAVQKTDPRS